MSETRSVIPPELLREWNRGQYRIKQMGRSIRCVVFGESHYCELQMARQAELIELVRPEVLLHEFGNPAMVYDPARPGSRAYLRASRRVVFPAPLIEQASRLGHRIVGIDLSLQEISIAHYHLALDHPEDFDWQGDNVTDGVLVKRQDPHYQFTAADPITMRIRDARMSWEIGKWERKMKTPLLVVVGAHHARNFYRRKLLAQFGFGCAFVHQTEELRRCSTASKLSVEQPEKRREA